MNNALRKIVKDCQLRNIPVVMTMLPELHSLQDYPFQNIHEIIESSVNETGSIYIDLLLSLKGYSSSDTWVSPDDAHPNEKTHARYAHFLNEQLIWNELLAEAISRKQQKE